MKKVLLIGGLGVMLLASCKKDYTCECVNTLNGTSIGNTTTTITDTKNKAKDACDALSANAGFGGLTASSSCSLK